jgi:hypothetical protein
MEKTTTKYVLQNSDGEFYWKDKSVSSRYGFTEDFSKAYIFDSEKGAKTRLYLAGENGVIRPVIIGLPRTISIPSVWIEEETKKTPSKCSWASIGDDNSYDYGEKYYDADGNEITKEEYEALLDQTQD